MIPHHYLIETGILFGGEYPGDRNPEVVRARILALVELGVRTFIDLTSPQNPIARIPHSSDDKKYLFVTSLPQVICET